MQTRIPTASQSPPAPHDLHHSWKCQFWPKDSAVLGVLALNSSLVDMGPHRVPQERGPSSRIPPAPSRPISSSRAEAATHQGCDDSHHECALHTRKASCAPPAWAGTAWSHVGPGASCGERALWTSVLLGVALQGPHSGQGCMRATGCEADGGVCGPCEAGEASACCGPSI